MFFLFVQHTVKNFDHWKPVYQAHQSARAAAGLEEIHLFQDAANANHIVILFRAKDDQKAKALAESKELREAMAKAGVIGQPEIRFLTEA